ncbi:hypothetical protein BDA99DRAFT_409943, partial [Phascolomyces articulosus]
EVRMSRKSFLIILMKTRDHTVFVSKGPKSQKPVLLQLLVTFRRLSFYGNASVGCVARYCGVGIMLGSVINYANRCVKAILSLKLTYVCWPPELDKNLSKNEFGAESGFTNYIGIIDGTLFPFANEPHIKPPSYFS